MTKLDESFVTGIKQSIMSDIDALANEVRRLEAYCAELESMLTPEQVSSASAAAAIKW